jgi:hypothetical protein
MNRNKVIYELYERNHAVDEISSITGIPRSTVGYYVRKFNKLAVKGKPVVFASSHKEVKDPFKRFLDETVVRELMKKSIEMLTKGQAQQLYYFLMDLKLLKEFDLLLTSEDIDKAIRFLGLE